jgi:hypothetical protein
MYVFIPIGAIFIHQLSKKQTNDFVGGFYSAITLWVKNG